MPSVRVSLLLLFRSGLGFVTSLAEACVFYALHFAVHFVAAEPAMVVLLRGHELKYNYDQSANGTVKKSMRISSIFPMHSAMAACI